MKSWLQDNRIEMYSTHNEGKCLLLLKDFRVEKVIKENDKLYVKWKS